MIITPFKSVGLIKFGAKIETIEDVFGEPEAISELYGIKQLYFPNDLPCVSFVEDRVVEVTFQHNAEVTIDGINPFKSADGWKQICALDTNPIEYLGTIFLLELGINLGGFHNNHPAEYSLSSAKEGWHEQFYPEMKKFDLPEY